jgi:methyl-accepting chemotaxis protein
MQDIVDSVARVEEIMAQIKHASAEQHAGILACSQAVVQMDHGTQQNAALVEQVAAAAHALQEQSGQLEHAVSRFKIAPAAGAAPVRTLTRGVLRTVQP